MLIEHTTSVARIPVVKVAGGAFRHRHTHRYEIVAHAAVDRRDAEFLAGFVWTLLEACGCRYAFRHVPGTKDQRKPMTKDIWERHCGEVPGGMTIDHIDRDTLNNRLDNLRLATRSQQQINQAVDRSSTTGYKGVSWQKREGAYRAKVEFKGRQFYLGLYSRPTEAAFAYNVAVRLLHGEFGWLNPIPGDAIPDARLEEMRSDIADRVARQLSRPVSAN